MIELEYAPKFLRQLYKLERNIQEEALQKIALFKDSKNHQHLDVHKLHGHLKDKHAFYITGRVRVLFKYQNPKFASLLAIGDHEIYKEK